MWSPTTQSNVSWLYLGQSKAQVFASETSLKLSIALVPEEKEKEKEKRRSKK